MPAEPAAGDETDLLVLYVVLHDVGEGLVSVLETDGGEYARLFGFVADVLGDGVVESHRLFDRGSGSFSL